MKSVTLKFNDDKRGNENKAFDEAMKKNPPVMEIAIQTAKGVWRKKQEKTKKKKPKKPKY